VRQDIQKDVPVSEMQRRWQVGLSQFEKVRQKYLLYK